MNRKIDELGRIVIPMEIRKKLNISSNDKLNIKVVNNEIILSKEENIEELIKQKENIEEKINELLKKEGE